MSVEYPTGENSAPPPLPTTQEERLADTSPAKGWTYELLKLTGEVQEGATVQEVEKAWMSKPIEERFTLYKRDEK